MNATMLEAEGLTVTLGGKKLLNNISFNIRRGEQWVFTGESGSGKTILAETLVGKHFFRGRLDMIKSDAEGPLVFVAQQHHFKNRSNTSDFYYHQRYNAYESETTLTVKQWLGGKRFADRAHLLKLSGCWDWSHCRMNPSYNFPTEKISGCSWQQRYCKIHFWWCWTNPMLAWIRKQEKCWMKFLQFSF